MLAIGQYLEIATLGRWWADLPREEWPPGAEEEITRDFEGNHGDRRQELVFIGQFSNDKGTQFVYVSKIKILYRL